MEPHQERVVAEREELEMKIAGLTKFIDSQMFDRIDMREQSRLIRQRLHMQAYSLVLYERIQAFTDSVPPIPFDQSGIYG